MCVRNGCTLSRWIVRCFVTGPTGQWGIGSAASALLSRPATHSVWHNGNKPDSMLAGFPGNSDRGTAC